MLDRPLPSTATTYRTGQLYGASRGLFLSRQISQFKGLSVIVTHDMAESEQLAHEVSFYREQPVTTLHFPDLETLAYDHFSPHQDIISERLNCLARLPSSEGRAILLLSIGTLLQRVAPQSYIAGRSISIAVGDRIDFESFKTRLTTQAYEVVTQVEQHGELAVRGSIIDLFPMGSKYPLRIELFDDEVESIRRFDPETQLSQEKLQRFELLPGREYPLDETAIKTFRQRFRQTFDADPNACPVYQDISQGLSSPGVEYYLPLFFDHLDTLFDYLPAQVQFLIDQQALDGCPEFLQQIDARYQSRRHNLTQPLLAPEQLFLTMQQLEHRLEALPVAYFSSTKYIQNDEFSQNLELKPLPPLAIRPHSEQPLQALKDYLVEHDDYRVLFCAESAGRREFMLEMLAHHDLRPRVVKTFADFVSNRNQRLFITVSPLESGLQLDQQRIALIAESQLFGERARQSRRRRYRKTRDADAIVSNLTDLRQGAPVVHEDHGIGRYQGLTTLKAGGIETEFLCISYADSDKLYVPVSSLHLISRYTGTSEESAPLHRLGSDRWTSVRRKAQQKIRDVAAELLEIHARRAALQGFAFGLNRDEYQQFASEFPFEETPDQQSAIEAVIDDLCAPRPMDRIVCGDVGFGKTEVSMRAAFVAASGGKQVVMLAPTTLLAQQHYQNFLDRFADWPVKIALLSRFTAKKDLDDALAKIASGVIDIVIGTHKLLSDAIRYKNLGLVIIDEEHRFGVRHKEKLKSLRAQVDLLTMTATPIPRTLNMSLSGMRDLSIIATPPMHRHAIKTFVAQWNDDTIVEGCQRELKRGGQVYFLHNEVKTIDRTARQLEELVPGARIGIAHGQMKEKELEQVMLDFYHHRVNLLVCTTIIESGIDVPTANTIFINRADKLGLAQLHQIRGRVGRSHHRAFAYLMTPHPRAMTADARKRLQAIEALEDLGVGFTLASHDLEIRGAGELLGEEQSGQIAEIGFTLYSELLERAVRTLRQGGDLNASEPLMRASEIDFHVPALIPESYIPDVHLRLIEYKRLASLPDRDSIHEFKSELVDRFGLIPDALNSLLKITEMKLITRSIGIEKIDFGPESGKIVFSQTPNIDPMNVIKLIQKSPTVYQFDGKQTLGVGALDDGFDQRVEQLRDLLEKLTRNET